MPPQRNSDQPEQGDRELAKLPEGRQPPLSTEQWQDIFTLKPADAGRVTAEHAVNELFGVPTFANHAEIFERPAKQAIEPPPPVSDTLKQAPYDSAVKLNVQITNVPEVSPPVQSLDDAKALGTGIGQGLLRVGEETLNYLATPGAVNNTLLQIGPALDNAVNYYANTPVQETLRDTQEALSYAGQLLEDPLGHSLEPAQRGEHAGLLMPVFVPIGGKRPLSEAELDALGGATKLEQMTEKELEALGIRKVAGAGGDWPVINERPSSDVVRQTEKMSCVSACGEMLSEGTIDQATLIEQMGTPADVRQWAEALGPPWAGGGVRPDKLDELLKRGSWAADLREPAGIRYRRMEPGHTVVVDGLDEYGNIKIRDPADGTRYEMTRKDFLYYWSGRSVFRN